MFPEFPVPPLTFWNSQAMASGGPEASGQTRLGSSDWLVFLFYLFVISESNQQETNSVYTLNPYVLERDTLSIQES